ncbi:MAG: glycosyltransferase [Eubacteriales bacterium]|nr:glycosyltransferase [Eubacteriales bacterium]
MIKVMQVMTDTNIGGAGIWLLNFLNFYDREKLDVTVIIPKNSALKERIEALDTKIIEADNIADKSFSKDGIATLKEILEAEKPDVVHTHASLSARIAAKLLKIPVINTRHCIEPKKSGIKRLCYRIINRALSDRAVAVSKAVYNNLVDDGIPEDKITVIYNGVPDLKLMTPDEREEVRSELGLTDSIAVGIIARLEPVKNHFLFLEAAAAAYEINDKFRFVIVGDGSMEKEIKAEVERKGITDAVIFTGYVKDTTAVMNAIDINVLTSDREALSISLIEGMSVGKPCITTDAGGTREVVENGKSGIVVPVGDAVNLTAALLRLASDAELMTEYGKEGMRIAKEKFQPTEMCDKLTVLYEDTAALRRGE